MRGPSHLANPTLVPPHTNLHLVPSTPLTRHSADRPSCPGSASQDAQSKLLVVGRAGNEAAEGAAKLAEGGIPCLGLAVAPGGAGGAVPTLSVEPRSEGCSEGCSVTAAGEEKGEGLEDLPRPDDVALFLHTSGTTSRPKGVPLSHANLAASLDNIKQV